MNEQSVVVKPEEKQNYELKLQRFDETLKGAVENIKEKPFQFLFVDYEKEYQYDPMTYDNSDDNLTVAGYAQLKRQLASSFLSY